MLIQKLKNLFAYDEKFKIFAWVIKFLKFIIKILSFLAICGTLYNLVASIFYFANVGDDGSGGLALLGAMVVGLIPLYLLIGVMLVLFGVKTISLIFNRLTGIKRFIAIQLFIMGIIIIVLFLCP